MREYTLISGVDKGEVLVDVSRHRVRERTDQSGRRLVAQELGVVRIEESISLFDRYGHAEHVPGGGGPVWLDVRASKPCQDSLGTLWFWCDKFLDLTRV